MLRMLLRKLTWLSLNSLARLRLRVRELGERLFERGGVRVGDAAVHLRRTSRGSAAGRSSGRRSARERRRCRTGSRRRAVEDAFDGQVELLAGRGRDRDRRADLQIVVFGEAVVDEGAVRAQLGEDRLRAFLPVQVDRARAVRRDRRDEARVAVDQRLAGADARHLLDAGRLLGCLGRLDRDRGEVVLRRDRVVGDEDAVDGVGERRADALPEHGDECDEREADHQGGRGRRRALRVALRVPARELARRPRRAWRPASRAPSRGRGRASRRRARRRRRRAAHRRP